MSSLNIFMGPSCKIKRVYSREKFALLPSLPLLFLVKLFNDDIYFGLLLGYIPPLLHNCDKLKKVLIVVFSVTKK